MVGYRERIYRRTESGRKALESERSGLPAAFRQILGAIEDETTSAEVFGEMRGFPVTQVSDWLDQLETLCFIETAPRNGDLQVDGGWSAGMPHAA